MSINRRAAVIAAGVVGFLTSATPLALAAPSDNPQAPQGANGADTSLSQQEGTQPPTTSPQAGQANPRNAVPANPQATPGSVPPPAQPELTPQTEGAPEQPAAPTTGAPAVVTEAPSEGWSEYQQWSEEPTTPAAPAVPEPPKEGPPFVTVDVTLYGVPELPTIELPPLPAGIVLPPPPVEIVLHQVTVGQGANVQVSTAPPLPDFHL